MPRWNTLFSFCAAMLLAACSNSGPRPPGSIQLSVNAITSSETIFTYGARIDSATPRALNSLIASSFLTNGLAVGRHTVDLTTLPSNCTSGSDSRPVDLAGGDTVTVNFAITCLRSTGDLIVSATTTGADLPPRYGIGLNGVTIAVLATNGADTLHRLPPVTSNVDLTAVVPNCTVGGTRPRSVKITAGVVSTVAFVVTCVPQPKVTLPAPDPIGDTLATGSTTAPAAIDLRSAAVRYAASSVIFSFKFTVPIVSAARAASNSLNGFFELDVDENTATGNAPGINVYGGSAVQGADYHIDFFTANDTSVSVFNTTGTTTRVPAVFNGDSVVVTIPLQVLGNDDGNMSLTAVFGTPDRPTDIFPNSGIALARVGGVAIPLPAGKPALPLPRAGAVARQWLAWPNRR